MRERCICARGAALGEFGDELTGPGGVSATRPCKSLSCIATFALRPDLNGRHPVYNQSVTRAWAVHLRPDWTGSDIRTVS